MNGLLADAGGFSLAQGIADTDTAPCPMSHNVLKFYMPYNRI